MGKIQHIKGFSNRYIGSYMSAHVLLNLLNKMRKSDKMGGLPSILSLFRNKFNKFNNTGAQLLHSIYHMTFKLIKNCPIGETSRFCHFLHNVIMDMVT